VTASTFSGNRAVGGNGNSFGGGIVTTGTLIVTSSIVAANSAHDGPDISGVLTSGGYNLIQNSTGATGLNAPTDGLVTLSELQLAPTLGNNGGPTQTLALLQGSRAIDAGVCSITFTDALGQTVTITKDQRGEPRPGGSENACDIGAYESSY
jgi:hypothetical protein